MSLEIRSDPAAAPNGNVAPKPAESPRGLLATPLAIAEMIAEMQKKSAVEWSPAFTRRQTDWLNLQYYFGGQ